MELINSSNGHLSLSSEPIYNCVQKVVLKSKTGEEKFKILRVTVELKPEKGISLEKALSLQVTDDNDYSFFFSLLLTLEDFNVLKGQQGLLVGFEHFPSQLIKLLDICKDQDVKGKFMLILEEKSTIVSTHDEIGNNCAMLKIIETNHFKNLCHLSLKMCKGSDTDIKNHMSIKLAILREKLGEEENLHKMAKINLNDALKAVELKTKELAELKLKSAEEKSTLRFEMTHQLSEEREKMTKLQLEWQQRCEVEKSQLVMQYQKQLNELNEQINLLTFNNKNLYENKCQLETSIKEKNFLIETLEKQILQMSQELSCIKKQNTQLDQDYHEKDTALVNLKTKLAVYEQELKDKEKFLATQQEFLKAASEQKLFLEEALSEKETNLQRKQSALETLSADLIKANEIISKLQNDLALNKSKMKLRTDIALEQEKILEKKNMEINNQNDIINDLKKKMVDITEELELCKKQLEEANKKIEEKDSTIKKNDNVINWLNRRLTESSSTVSTSSNIISSSRTYNESFLPAAENKGNVSTFSKKWPPWLLNSVINSNTLNLSNLKELPMESFMEKSVGASLNDHDDKINKEINDAKNCKSEISMKKDDNSMGLDPKYFQSSTDKDFIINPTLVKTNITANYLKPKFDSISEPTIAKHQKSAYFPKTPIPL